MHDDGQGAARPREEAGALTLTPHLQAASSPLSRKSCFLAMTFMAKEMTGMSEREVAAPPARRTSILWGDSWVQVRVCWKILGKSLAFTKPQCSMHRLEVDAATYMS